MEFTVVKAQRSPKIKVKKTKYGRLFSTMKDLKTGDHVIVFSNIAENLVNQRLHNMVRGLSSFKELLPRRKFEISTITSTGGENNDIIVKRIE